MAKVEALNVESRKSRGSKLARKMRQQGKIPAVLYGHGQETVSLAVPVDDMESVLRHHSRVVELRGGANETAMISALQWNTWGTDVLHVDFLRVSRDEKIELEVPIELRGTAPGVREGGVIQFFLHSVQVECAATDVPEKLVCNINDLQLNHTYTVANLSIPEGVKVLEEADKPVVACVVPQEAPEEEAVPGAGVAEPEVIGRKEEAEAEDGE